MSDIQTSGRRRRIVVKPTTEDYGPEQALDSIYELLRATARDFGCITEYEMCALYGITQGTANQWRKSRRGPAYLLAGCNYLYPISAIQEDLQSRLCKWDKPTEEQA